MYNLVNWIKMLLIFNINIIFGVERARERDRERERALFVVAEQTYSTKMVMMT